MYFQILDNWFFAQCIVQIFLKTIMIKMFFNLCKKGLDVNLLSDMYSFLAIASQVNPTCNTYVSQSLQGHSWGTQFLISALNVFSVSEFFISFGKMSRIKKETDSVSYLAEFILYLIKKLFPCKLQLQFCSTSTSFKRCGEGPYRTLNFSMAKVLLFLWCIVTELSLSNKSWKDDDLWL